MGRNKKTLKVSPELMTALQPPEKCNKPSSPSSSSSSPRQSFTPNPPTRQCSNTATATTFQILPKAQRTRGLSSSFQSNLLGHITSSNFIFKISTKHSLQNPHQTSPPRLNLKFKILTKPCILHLNQDSSS